jgi:hypothetical protein
VVAVDGISCCSFVLILMVAAMMWRAGVVANRKLARLYLLETSTRSTRVSLFFIDHGLFFSERDERGGGTSMTRLVSKYGIS